MEPRPISNPPNPWASTDIEYFDEIPEAKLEVYEDHTRQILATNDSPDLGFRFSVNPYRGCYHACAYCLSGDTEILMGDASTRLLRDLLPGDVIYGTERRGNYRRYVRTRVLAHWQTFKPAVRIRFENGGQLIASGDHRFLTRRGWKYVTGEESGPLKRPHLTTNDKLMGFGALPEAKPMSVDYRRGYLSGMIRGDALLRVFRYARAGRANGDQYQFRLALTDLEALRRVREYLLGEEVTTHEFLFQAASESRRAMAGIRTSARPNFERITSLIDWPQEPSLEWDRGFLAGIFDAEGSCSRGVLRISNTDPRLIAEIARCLQRHGFSFAIEPPRASAVATNVRLVGGLHERLRFFRITQTAISRKRDLADTAVRSNPPLRVRAIESLGVDVPMFDITTGTGDFIANGVISHNCYARPTHEYLSFGAGTDFDRKITVKPEAPRLLREAFDRPSWKGELIVFSGVTDCYQPLEASYRLTRGCLEVCAEYRNPIGIITKAPLIERDLEVLVELARVAQVGVTISIPFWDEAHARAIEPYVATPHRRVRTIEKLARAGIDVGVNVAPVIPGLNDQDIVRVLEAAAGAGAKHAGFVFLRLPGSVKQVFEERVRAALPLRADRILSRIREARSGKLYDSRFGKRQRGEGAYAEAAQALFDATCRRLGLNVNGGMSDREPPPPTFTRPARAGQQLELL